jgi:hypothetical protein
MSYNKPRIKSLSISPMEILVDFSEGNPGAASVLAQLFANAEKIDPDSALGAMGPIFSLDNLDCYGPRIWMFYKDVCGQDINKMMGVMRACQMGILSERDITAAIDGDKSRLNIPEALTKLKEKLPAFAIEKAA